MSARKRVSQACKPCSQKKIKCDGGYPRCSTCQQRNDECSYGISKRRGPNKRTEHNGLMGSLQESTSGNTIVESLPLNPQYLFTISPETSKRLFQAYFDSIHPLWPLLYKPLYTSLDLTYPSPTIPTALVLAIFAIAACVANAQSSVDAQSEARDRGQCPEPQVLFEGALDMLQQGTGSENIRKPINSFIPSVTNCQVLVILALQQHGVAEYARAATLVAVAAAMAIELRLHRFYEPNEPIEREIRSRLWWNLYILEKMLSTEMGRPVLLRSEETDCVWPSVSESDEFELMSSPLHREGRNSSIKMKTISGLHTTISLSCIFERICREIYGIAARKTIRDNQNAGERLRMELWHEIQKWEENVEASPLRLDLSDQLVSVPPAITNNVIMWTATILLHRPFIARWRPDLDVQPTASPYDVCLQAANKICIVLEKYLERLPGGPCDMVFSIFTAASILLHHSKQVEGQEAAETRRRLKQCIHWLSVLGKSWKIAGARHQLLNELFDLPQALQEPRMTTATAPPMNFGQDMSQLGPLSNLLNPMPGAMPSTASQNFEDDWSFLRGFGDSTDQLYSWDVELRDLLDGGFALNGEGYV